MIHNIPQPAFEQYLTDVLAKDSNVDIRRGVSFISLRQVSKSLRHEKPLNTDFGGGRLSGSYNDRRGAYNRPSIPDSLQIPHRM